VKPAERNYPTPSGLETPRNAVFMDDRDASLGGDWQIVQLDAANNRSYRTAANGGRPATATYTIPVEKEGRYYVQLWWPEVANAGSRVDVEIAGRDSTDVYHLNQREYAYRWRTVGEVNAGPQHPVTLKFSSEKANGYVVIDGVKLDPILPATR
jgi:hypothetical protein